MKHILMVDDVATNLKSAAEVLQPYYRLSMAKSGKQALQFLKKTIPDLILLDLMMPEMDGYETMEQIRLNPTAANIPIIFLTADTEQASEIRGIQMGAMDFITKPFKEDVMLGRIEKVLMMEDMRKSLLSGSEEDMGTGLLTKEALAGQIGQEAPQAVGNTAEDGEISGTAVLINIDNFRLYNTANGQEKGDSILKKFADGLKKLQADHSYDDDRNILLGRLAGDEFLFYFPSLFEEHILRRLCEEEIPELLKAEYSAEGDKEGGLTVSVAVAYMHGGMDFEALYQNLRRAMYHVKQSGKNGWHIYQE